MKVLMRCLFAACLLGCNNVTSDAPEVDTLKVDSVATAAAAVSETCYENNAKGNKILLSLRRNGTDAEGDLDYAIAEKDKNIGTIKGAFSGDTLTAMYTFQSEGTESIREVKFLVRDSVALEGYGKVQVNNQKAQFVPNATISYGKGIVLKRVACK